MTTLLAVETSASLCSLAILVDGDWIEDTQNVERAHNQVVLGNLEALRCRAGIGPGDFTAVAFAAGPGSFTGIRIAAALAQGVAFGCGAGVVPVSSSLALALAGRRHPELPADAAGLITVTRSRRDACYLAAFRLTAAGQIPVREMDDVLHQGTDRPGRLPGSGWVGVGDRPDWWPDERPFLDSVAVTARLVGELALPAVAANDLLPPEAALPVYVSGDSPWQPAPR
ncbi:MAG: tRNA (adenosine(37)-N6)-threonylcarbamoyltransferase complex dimerization subunit type 1 TsaB [Gammaproteobacteria bacterium]|nr:tRNA (adenosine(37)-N6)-threonylcarbamoyltransferase complex dimerization subunit type 1 TsaB [Gammaproteobacteria bacterium]